MNHLLTAIACCLAVAGSAQSDGYPFNPDADGDGLITVEDLLAVLSSFGQPAEFETCYRGEPYEIKIQDNGFCNWHIPADCGIFLRYDNCYCTLCYTRLPSAANEGDVIYCMLRRSYFYNTHQVHFQTYEDDEWVTFFTYTEMGDSLLKFTFDGETWSGEIHGWTNLYQSED